MSSDTLDLKWDWKFSTDGDDYYSESLIQWLGKLCEEYPPISIFEVPVVFEIKAIPGKKQQGT